MLNRSSKHSNFALVILIGALLLIFHRLLVGEAFFWGLPSLQFYPWREYALDTFRSGHLPFWNPYNGSGAPLLANYQSALLYPLNWFGLVLPIAWSMSVTAVVHLFIAGCGMWMFTGKVGLTELGRGMSAISFALTGYLVARLGTYPTIFAAAWIPWLMWAALKVLADARRRDIGWLAVFAAMQLLAGHAQTTYYSMLLLAIFSMWWGISQRVKWQRLLLLVVGIVVGAGIASAQLLPTAELLAQSQRSGGVDYDTVMNFSYAPARMMNFIAPNIFGTPANGTYATKGAFFEDAVYLGFIPLISALVAIVTWAWGKLRRSKRPEYFSSVPFWLVIVLVAFVLALGKHSSIFPFLYEHIPTFAMFQAPVRWHIWTVFGLSVLAGIGVGMWTRGYWVLFGTRLATAAAVGAALLALVAPEFLPAELVQEQAFSNLIQAVITTGIIGALAGILTLAQPELPIGSRYKWWMTAVWLVIAGDLVYAGWGLNPTVPASFYDKQEVSASQPNTRGYWPTAIDEALKFDDDGYLQFDDYPAAVARQAAYRASELPNLNLIDRLPQLNNFEPLLIDAFKQYADLIDRHPAQRDTLLRAAGVGYVYDHEGKAVSIGSSATRAWFVDAACWHPDRESLEKALVTNWNPAQVVHLIGQGECSTESSAGAESNTVDTISDSSDSVILKVTANRAGWLVLADAYYPGWEVTLDGKSADIQQANLMFRAVQIPAGTSEVRFEYHFRWLLPGLLISITSLLVVLVLFRSKEPDLPTG